MTFVSWFVIVTQTDKTRFPKGRQDVTVTTVPDVNYLIRAFVRTVHTDAYASACVYVLLFLARTRMSLDSDQPESLPVSEWTGEMSAAWAERNLSAHVAEAFRGEVALWESISDVDTPVVLIIRAKPKLRE